jgi:hypothetical protein
MEAIASVYLDPDERVVRHIKVEAPTFDGFLNPWFLTICFFFFFFDKWFSPSGCVTWTTSFSDTIYQKTGGSDLLR